MFNKRKIASYGIIITLMVAVVGCSDSGAGPDLSHYDASAILQNDARNVILQTYIDLNTEAEKLVTAVQTLQKNTTQANLEAARKQWRNTRVPWESSESFLFGPVETEQIDPHIDSWPLNKIDLDNVLSGNAELTEEYIRNQTNNLKGFHTIEYLLWGGYNEHKQAADLTKRELSYMVAAAKALKDETQSLVTSWSPEGGGYVDQLAEAGKSSAKFKSQKAALQRLVGQHGMIGIANEVANSKIDDPYSQKNPEIVESQFSFNSKADFQNNIRSIWNLYTGDYGEHSGPGISQFVASKDASLDKRFKKEVQTAIEAIGNIKGAFRDAIIEHRQSVENAQQKVRTVLSTLKDDIEPLVSNEF